MQNPYAQVLSKIMLINDLRPTAEHAVESLIHWDFPEEEGEPSGKLSLNCGEWGSSSDEQEWQDDYCQSIRL